MPSKIHQQINAFPRTRLGNSATKVLVPCWRRFVDSGAHFGRPPAFAGVPKSTSFAYNQDKIFAKGENNKTIKQ